MTRFSTLNPDGSESNVRTISQDTIRACPNVILVPEHYPEVGPCECFDKEVDMDSWGYVWSDENGHWS